MRIRRLALLAALLLATGMALAGTGSSSAPPQVPGAAERSGVRRPAPLPWFSPRSPLNRPIARAAQVDPASDAIVRGIVHAAELRGWAISVKRWTVPVYYADRSTPRKDVRLTASWRAANVLARVPIPDAARPDPGSSSDTDGHMAIIDRSTGCFYEFYEAVRRDDGRWEAQWANRGWMSGTGIQPGGYSTRASGFVNFAGLIRPSELRAGRIEHALAFGYPYTKAGGPVRPATASDGRSASESGEATGLPRPADALPMPEGARLRLDPSLDIDTLGLAPWQKTIARALQLYGMYLTDTSTAPALGAVNAQSWRGKPYARFWGDEAYAYLPTSLVKHVQVLKLPHQYRPRGYLAGSGCGRLG